MSSNTTTTMEEARYRNNQLFEKLSSTNPEMNKQAADALTAYTKTQMREDGVFRRILTMQDCPDSELQRSIQTDKPVVVVELEPNSPAAMSVPFATLPQSLYIRGNRYEVQFERLMTTRFTKDVSDLRTWRMDIRQVISDNSVRDMMAEEDSNWFKAVNTVLGAANSVVATSGVVQYQTIANGITRDNLVDGSKVLPNTPSSFEVQLGVVNHITIKDVAKFGRDEAGDDMSGDLLRDGVTRTRMLGHEWISTIKKAIVPTGTVYYFADPDAIGKSYSLEDTTMHVKKEAFFVEFFAYEEIGAAIGNTNSVARVDYLN